MSVRFRRIFHPLQVLMKGVDLDLISRKVLPALVTLASDSQM